MTVTLDWQSLVLLVHKQSVVLPGQLVDNLSCLSCHHLRFPGVSSCPMQPAKIRALAIWVVARGIHTAIGNLIHMLDAYWLNEDWALKIVLPLYQSIE